MQGGHDLGGMQGLGPIGPEPEASEPVFHADWEKTVFWLTLSCGSLGQWSIDASRHARERQHPASYILNTYYENWLEGLQTLLLENEILSADEVADGTAKMEAPETLRDRNLTVDRVASTLRKGGPSIMPEDGPPKFSPGDQVQVTNNHPTGHTRVPGYLRGRTGTVETYCGWHVFPDKSAIGKRAGQPLYRVVFSAQSVWGSAAKAGDSICADLWESYLHTV